MNITHIELGDAVGELTNAYGVWAETPDVLRLAITFPTPLSPKPPIEIEMPCGNTMPLRTTEDIPDADVPCPCGDERHWLVKYGSRG